MFLTREETTQMKGIAILCIAIHNFCHYYLFGFCQENEMGFHYENWTSFLNVLAHPSFDFIFHFFSFWGWLGVPVFVILSGYGLVKKYESENTNSISIKEYILRNFKKLFFLMLPGVLFFILISIAYGNTIGGAKMLLYLTLLNNIILELNPFNPGVYWYFGLAFQLYLAYLIYYKYRNYSFLYASIVIFLLLMYTVPLSSDGRLVMKFMKNNFIGWLPLFLCGVWIGRKDWSSSKELPRYAFAILTCILLVLSVFMNSNYYLWIALPFCVTAFFYCFIKCVKGYGFINKILTWLGIFSASIFVANPVARVITLRIMQVFSPEMLSSNAHVSSAFFSIFVPVYILITCVLAYYNNKLYRWCRTHFIDIKQKD